MIHRRGSAASLYSAQERDQAILGTQKSSATLASRLSIFSVASLLDGRCAPVGYS